MTTAGPTFSGASPPSQVRSSDHERREGPAAGAGPRELLRREIRWLCLDRLAVGAAVLVLVAATSSLPRLAALFARRERKDVALVHHVAVAIEHDALVHDEGRGHDVGLHAGVSAELDRVARFDLAVDLAIDHDGAAGDVSGDLGGLADDEEIVGGDLTGEGAVEADLTLEAQLSLENEARPKCGVSRRVGAPALVFTHVVFPPAAGKPVTMTIPQRVVRVSTRSTSAPFGPASRSIAGSFWILAAPPWSSSG